MSRAGSLIVLAAAVVGLTAVTGGAFTPAPRVVVTTALALVLGCCVARYRVKPARDEATLLAFIMWGCVSALLIGAMPLRAKEVLTAWLVTWLLWVLVRRGEEHSRQAVLVVLAGTGGILAVAVVLEWLGLRSLRAAGLLENPNVTAALLVPTCAVVAAMTRDQWRTNPRPLGKLLLLLLLGLGLLLTGSRAGLLAAVAAMVVVLPGKRLRLAALVLGGAIVGGLICWRLSTQPEPLAWHRGRIWLSVLQLAVEHPVAGVSPGALGDAAGPARLTYPERIGKHPYLITYAESTPLAVAVQTGGVGAALALGGLLLWLARSREQLAAPAVGGTLATMVVVAAFHDLLEIEVVLWWWALLLGAVAPNPPAADQHQPLSTRRAVVALGLTWLLLWGLVQPALAGLVWWRQPPSLAQADRVYRLEPWFATPARWRTGMLLQQAGWTWQDAAAAVVWSRRTVAAEPGRARGWNHLAEVHTRIINELGLTPESVAQARHGFQRACALEPHLPWYWLAWAGLERTLGQLERARALTRTAVSEEPSCVRGWLLLARLELDLGRLDAARTALRRAQAARREGQQRVLESYERELLAAPPWQWRQLERALIGDDVERGSVPGG